MTPEERRAMWERVMGPDTRPRLFVQWKGTDLCCDIECECGEYDHLDVEFAYAVKCLSCGRAYALRPRVELVPLSSEEADDYGPSLHSFGQPDDGEEP